jgi:phosphonate transport system permease protein
MSVQPVTPHRDEATPRPAALASPPPPQSVAATIRSAAGLIALGVVVAWAWNGTGFELGRFGGSLAPLAEFLGRMTPPDASAFAVAMKSTVETLQMAVLGTFLAVVLSIPPALLAAVNLTPPWIHQPVRWVLALLRGIPLLLLALMFVAALGLGPVPGVLALAVHSVGMLAKFYADAFESARPGPIEALDSVGANWIQRVRFGVLTQVAPDLARDTLFRFELNLRESLVLGLVGAGGIGFYIQLYIRSFQYQRVATLTLVILLLVVVVEQGSVAIRRRLS